MPYNLTKNTLKEIWESKDIENLRGRFLRGERPPECHLCWVEESAGNYSLRKQAQADAPESLEAKKLEYLVLKLSNLCNLKCAICNPDLSSVWMNTAMKQGWGQTHYTAEERQLLMKPKIDQNNLDYIRENAPHLKRILIYGGEPFLNKEVRKILTTLDEMGYSQNITITLNSNGTVYEQDFIDLILRFKAAYLSISIDDIGERAEYQRAPCKWEEVEANLKRLNDISNPKLFLQFYATVSALNVFYLREYFEWAKKYDRFLTSMINILHVPHYLSIKNLPKQTKLAAKNYLAVTREFDHLLLHRERDGKVWEVINDFLDLAPDQGYQRSDFWLSENLTEKLRQMNSTRETTFESAMPRLVEHLKVEGVMHAPHRLWKRLRAKDTPTTMDVTK